MQFNFEVPTIDVTLHLFDGETPIKSLNLGPRTVVPNKGDILTVRVRFAEEYQGFVKHRYWTYSNEVGDHDSVEIYVNTQKESEDSDV